MIRQRVDPLLAMAGCLLVVSGIFLVMIREAPIENTDSPRAPWAFWEGEARLEKALERDNPQLWKAVTEVRALFGEGLMSNSPELLSKALKLLSNLEADGSGPIPAIVHIEAARARTALAQLALKEFREGGSDQSGLPAELLHQAVTDLDRILQINPADPIASVERLQILLLLGKYGEVKADAAAILSYPSVDPRTAESVRSVQRQAEHQERLLDGPFRKVAKQITTAYTNPKRQTGAAAGKSNDTSTPGPELSVPQSVPPPP